MQGSCLLYCTYLVVENTSFGTFPAASKAESQHCTLQNAHSYKQIVSTFRHAAELTTNLI